MESLVAVFSCTRISPAITQPLHTTTLLAAAEQIRLSEVSVIKRTSMQLKGC